MTAPIGHFQKDNCMDRARIRGGWAGGPTSGQPEGVSRERGSALCLGGGGSHVNLYVC